MSVQVNADEHLRSVAAGDAAWAAAWDAAIRESIAAALEWLGDEAGAP